MGGHKWKEGGIVSAWRKTAVSSEKRGKKGREI